MTWRPFDLHPEYPAEGIPRAELVARYGERFHGRVQELFQRSGLAYNPPAEVVSNSRRALRVTELARERGLHERMHDRLMDAYWSEARDIGDPSLLLELAIEVGLASEEVRALLSSNRHLDTVSRSTMEAQSIGVTGVPAWLLDGRLLVLGAQPREVFEQAFARIALPEDA